MWVGEGGAEQLLILPFEEECWTLGEGYWLGRAGGGEKLVGGH